MLAWVVLLVHVLGRGVIFLAWVVLPVVACEIFGLGCPAMLVSWVVVQILAWVVLPDGVFGRGVDFALGCPARWRSGSW